MHCVVHPADKKDYGFDCVPGSGTVTDNLPGQQWTGVITANSMYNLGRNNYCSYSDSVNVQLYYI